MDQYNLNKYYAKMKFFKIFGNEIKIFNEDRTRLLFFVKQKAFKLREEIKVYANESMTQQLLAINARQIIDFSAAYDITDSTTKEKIGALRRKGLKSILRDEWEILDTSDNVIGKISEDSMGKALLRRFLSNLIPQTFHISINNTVVGILKQTFNPFIPQFKVDYSMDTAHVLDRRLGIAIVILLQVIEGRQR